jgi:hypothetical protein
MIPCSFRHKLAPISGTVASSPSKVGVGCNASGARAGAVGTSGSRVVKLGPAGNYDFKLSCRNAADSAGTALRLIAQ